MSKFVKTYRIRGTELDAEYRMRRAFAACYFQECFAEWCASKTMAAYDMQKNAHVSIEFVTGKEPMLNSTSAFSAGAADKFPADPRSVASTTSRAPFRPMKPPDFLSELIKYKNYSDFFFHQEKKLGLQVPPSAIGA